MNKSSWTSSKTKHQISVTQNEPTKPSTVCPRCHVYFDVAKHCMKMDKTFWTHSNKETMNSSKYLPPSPTTTLMMKDLPSNQLPTFTTQLLPPPSSLNLPPYIN